MKNYYQKVNIASEKSFGLVFSLLFFIIALWPIIFNNSSINFPFFVLGLIFLFLAFFFPKILKPLNKLWFKFGLILNKVVSQIILFFLFFFIVTPTGIIMRIFVKNFTNLKFTKSISSYWLKKSEKNQKMKNQF